MLEGPPWLWCSVWRPVKRTPQTLQENDDNRQPSGEQTERDPEVDLGHPEEEELTGHIIH